MKSRTSRPQREAAAAPSCLDFHHVIAVMLSLALFSMGFAFLTKSDANFAEIEAAREAKIAKAEADCLELDGTLLDLKHHTPLICISSEALLFARSQ